MIGLLVNCLEFVLNTLYRNRLYPRFFVLETVARVPYFAFTSVLHLYETFGWWRKADWLKVHFAESWNELHHLLIIESLEGNKYLIDRWVAHLGAFFYYWILVGVFMISPQSAYRFTQLVEEHAYHTYDAFLKKYSESLKGMLAPQIAIDYYRNGDLYMFDEFQTSHPPQERRPQIENLYDTFVAIRDDEGEHVKTMKACQEPRAQANFKSPHSFDRKPLSKETEIALPLKSEDTVKEVTGQKQELV